MKCQADIKRSWYICEVNYKHCNETCCSVMKMSEDTQPNIMLFGYENKSEILHYGSINIQSRSTDHDHLSLYQFNKTLLKL